MPDRYVKHRVKGMAFVKVMARHDMLLLREEGDSDNDLEKSYYRLALKFVRLKYLDMYDFLVSEFGPAIGPKRDYFFKSLNKEYLEELLSVKDNLYNTPATSS